MFGREKTPAAAVPAPETVATSVSTSGKGRPTPKRREAELSNRRPLVAGPRAAQTKEERKASKQAQRAAVRTERMQTRQALASGDERYLPARDKGPAKRFARDYVDSRRNPSEFFLPVALVAVVISLVPGLRQAAVLSMLLLYGMVAIVIVDLYLLRRRVTRLTEEKFGDAAKGAGGYAMMRALQMRRGRLPRPVVKRGQTLD